MAWMFDIDGYCESTLRMLDISKAGITTEGKLMHAPILSLEKGILSLPHEEAANQRLQLCDGQSWL